MTNTIGTSCAVHIENLGPEDSGIWEFQMIMKADTGGKVHKYKQSIQIDVKGNKRNLIINRTDVSFFIIFICGI